MELQAPHASDEFLFAVSAIGDNITQEPQVMHLDHTAQLVQIDIHPGGLQINSRSAWRCLFDTQTVGAVISDIEPSQGREFKPFFRTAVAAVPEAIEAIGVLTTFGHKTGCCPSIACMNTTSDQRERSRYTPDAQYTVCIRREPWSSPPVTVPTPNAHTMVNAASALIWSVVGPTAAFLGCCVPDVRAHF